ncbi:Unc-49B protein [Aphelenchoides besseyi]|nr:Unc-49B protein [Aphelenchoides besseyi]
MSDYNKHDIYRLTFGCKQQLKMVSYRKSRSTANVSPIKYRPSSLTFLLFTSLIFNLSCLVVALATDSSSENQETPMTSYISQILNGLIDPAKYDKRLRPRYGEGPVNVGITIHVSSISAVSEVDMDFTLDFYLRQTWQDPRLAFGKLDLGFAKIKELTVGVDYLDKLWKPDTFFPNEKKSFFHTATTHNSFLRIDPEGQILTSQRLTVTATCPMNLKLFPMDTQECKLEIESYGYTTDDIDYYWGRKVDTTDPPEKAVAFDKFSLPQFRRTGYRVNITTATTSSGAYDRLYVQVVISRNLGFYLMNIILPAMLIVMISWVSFWLNREASPARVTLGVTTVLTMTTLITTTNNSMPKVSYIKGLDVFLNFCFVMVFASLVEYAIVSYLNKRRARRLQAKKLQQERPESPQELPMFSHYPTTPVGGLAIPPNQTFTYNPNSMMSPTIPPDCDCRALPLIQYTQLSSEPFHPPLAFLKKRRRKRRRIYCCRELPSPSRIDRCSRVVFPCLFIIFNCVYWSILQKLSDNAVNKDYHDFAEGKTTNTDDENKTEDFAEIVHRHDCPYFNSNSPLHDSDTFDLSSEDEENNEIKTRELNHTLRSSYRMSSRRCAYHRPFCLIFVLCVVGYGCAEQSHNPFLAEEETPNTTYISQVLDRLTDVSKYDKRLRPRYGEGPVMVGITIHVSSISAVSEVDMDFTLDFYLRQTWQDPRLAFGKLDLGFAKIKELTVGVDYLDKLWKPDTFFPNEKKSFFHTATTHNSFLRIDPEGQILTSQRLTVTATCPMNLKLFPMDTQECKLEIESYGYTTDDIDYYWGHKVDTTDPPEKAVAFDKFSLPQFKRAGYRVNITTATTSSGAYDRLYFQVIMTRNIGFYLMNIIIPSMLIVSISWVSFWLNREASPARVGLGVTTVLTMTTLITTTNNSMPKVSYIKGLDVFLNFCFVMVFASLVEYAVVSYWNKRQCRRRQIRKNRTQQQEPTELPMFTNYPSTPAGGITVSPNHSYVYRPPGIPPGIPPDCDCRTIPLVQYAQLTNDNSFHQTIPFPKIRRRQHFSCRKFMPSPARIDRCSRIMFPALFIIFNLVYWTIMRKLSELAIKVDYQEFKE